MVTDADLAIQEDLAAQIARAFPDDAVVGEEGQWDADQGALYSWVLDPIDGTNNFGRGLPGFSISIGVLRNGQPYAGAVYDPISRWLFTGCVGRGAWLNDRSLRARPAPLTRSSLVSVRTPAGGRHAALRRRVAAAIPATPVRLDGAAPVLCRPRRPRSRPRSSGVALGRRRGSAGLAGGRRCPHHRRRRPALSRDGRAPGRRPDRIPGRQSRQSRPGADRVRRRRPARSLAVHRRPLRYPQVIRIGASLSPKIYDAVIVP